MIVRMLRRIRIYGGAYRHRHVGHSFPCGEDGGHDRRGMQDQPWMIDCERRVNECKYNQ